MSKLQAAGILIPHPTRKNTYIMLSRGTDTGQWGIPAGKRDATDKNLRMTASRETWEEAGIKVNERDLVPIYVEVSCGYESVTYLSLHPVYVDPKLTADDAPMFSDEGYVRWLPLESSFNGPFGEYNKNLVMFMAGELLLTEEQKSILAREEAIALANPSSYEAWENESIAK